MTPPLREIERIARLSYGRLVASLALRTGNIAAAQDALSDALIRALELWPQRGIPDNPEGWLLTTARNRAVDRVRTERLVKTYETELAILARQTEADQTPAFDPRIAMMFACAHPAIDAGLRAPLMLQTILGLDVRRMASVYLVSPATLGQRLTRAKQKILRTAIPLALPEQADAFAARLDDILAAIYAAYAVGHNAAGTADEKATLLAQEALWLVSTICDALPAAAEAHGLFALILFTQARQPARVDPVTGALVPLSAQDTGLWQTELLADAEQALHNAKQHMSLGRFQIEAAIQAVHANRRKTGLTDWAELRVLYRGLVLVSPGLGARTGQAAVEAEVLGPAAGLHLLDAIADAARDYQPWHATRAHLLVRLGEFAAADDAFQTAIGLSNDPATRVYLATQRSRLRH